MSDLDRIKGALATFIDTIMSRVDYHALYPARVVSQSGTVVDVVVDDARFGSITKVPLRTFAPDVVVTVQPNARVLIGFENGKPSEPYASLWQSGAIVSVAIAGSTDKVGRDSLIMAELNAIATTLGTGSNGAGTVAFGTPYVPGSSVGSTKLLVGG